MIMVKVKEGMKQIKHTSLYMWTLLPQNNYFLYTKHFKANGNFNASLQFTRYRKGRIICLASVFNPFDFEKRNYHEHE